MWTDAKNYQGLSRPLRAGVSFRVKAFQSIPRRILSTFCAISASLPGPIFSHHQLNAKTNQCEWRKMCWYAVTRLVSSILGCQEPRFSFQIATIVVLKSRPQQQTNHNGAVREATLIETSDKSFLTTELWQAHF